MSHTKKIVLSAVMVAVGILLPMAFHAIPNAGAVFAPMHLPVLITGFICGPLYGVLVGLICPLLSFITTGMPNAATLPNMMVELFFYGGCAGLFFRLIKTKKLVLDIFLSLIISLLIGRIMGGFVSYMMFLGGRKDAYSWTAFFTAYFVTCWPAIIIQLVVVPTVVEVARKIRFFSEADRYLDPNHHKKQIKKQRAFFDNLAKEWRKDETLSQEQIEVLLKNLNLEEGSRVLDVACGSGVLDGYLVEKGCTVDAIDISSQMILKAQANPRNSNVNYSVADFYEFTSPEKYDFILLFDAYPHFKDKISFAEKACELLKDGGTLLIFFDECRDKINCYHSGSAEGVSQALKPAEEEAKPFRRKFETTECYDGSDFYRLMLQKKPQKPLFKFSKTKR